MIPCSVSQAPTQSLWCLVSEEGPGVVYRDNVALEVGLVWVGVRWEVFSGVPTSNDCLRLSQHSEIRSCFVVMFPPLRSPVWTQKEQQLHCVNRTKAVHLSADRETVMGSSVTELMCPPTLFHSYGTKLLIQTKAINNDRQYEKNRRWSMFLTI